MSCVTIKAGTLINSDRLLLVQVIQDKGQRALSSLDLKRVPILDLKFDKVARTVSVKTIYQTLIYSFDEEILVEPSESISVIVTKKNATSFRTLPSWRNRVSEPLT